MKIAISGTMSALLLTAMLVVAHVFSDSVAEADQKSGDGNLGLLTVGGLLLMLIAFVVAVSIFFTYLAAALENRQTGRH